MAPLWENLEISTHFPSQCQCNIITTMEGDWVSSDRLEPLSKVTQLLSGEWDPDPRPSPPNPRLFLSLHFLTREKAGAGESVIENRWLGNLLGVWGETASEESRKEGSVPGHRNGRLEGASLFWGPSASSSPT